MNLSKQIIFLELNEVPWVVFKRYAQISKKFSGILSHFSYYETQSYDKIHLSPWITWPTVHRGVTFEKHRIQNLGQDISESDNVYPPIWETLKESKFSVGVYGSLHSSNFRGNLKDYKFYMPDIFSSHDRCYPKELQTIQDFQLKLSRKSARNVDKGVGGISALKVFLSMIRNGLQFNTFLKILSQLILEKIFKDKLSRRRVIQADINFDIFRNLLNQHSPSFSTFFTNHVASAMHRYWEAAYPYDFENQIQDSEWIKKYKNEINYSMKTTENILQSLIKYSKSRPNCEIWICTSMGQKAVNNYESISSQLILENPYKFLDFLGLDKSKYKVKPTMMPRFTFESNNELDLKFLEDKIKRLKLNNSDLEIMILGNTLTIRIMHWNTEPEFLFDKKKYSKEELGMNMIEIMDKTGTSAYHVPKGCLMIYGKDSERFKSKGIIPTHKIKQLIEETLLN